MMNCDPDTGACQIPDAASAGDNKAIPKKGLAVHYIGDPMCSWCWGISPALKTLEAFCAQQGIDFTVNVGGLRVGGGDPWTAQFKAFLRKEWSHIHEVSGQPFGYSLLDRESFNYDTEPACRAVVTVQLLQTRDGLPEGVVLAFFTAVQQHFYVDGADPRQVDFYKGPCEQAGLDFEAFKLLFLSETAQKATHEAFQKRHQWGVNSFPTLLLEIEGEVKTLANGYITADRAVSQLTRALPN
ncbi:protein-disulfide isomerase [Ectopseudomonas mendocina]|uniref:Protein-disulfide isomerase n=1 Tax=Ectopseudomonas mendocina TaxID=300 RepID=A0ABZ2RHJ4_ECTME